PRARPLRRRGPLRGCAPRCRSPGRHRRGPPRRRRAGAGRAEPLEGRFLDRRARGGDRLPRPAGGDLRHDRRGSSARRPGAASRGGPGPPGAEAPGLRLLRHGDAGARSRGAGRLGAFHLRREAVRSFSAHSSGRSGRRALRLRRGLSQTSPDLRAAPAAAAAAFFTAGILLGARAVSGGTAAAALAGCCLLLLAARRGTGTRALASTGAQALLWTSLGFFSGEARIARQAETARRTFRELPAGRDRADRIEGVLTEFWSGSPPRTM